MADTAAMNDVRLALIAAAVADTNGVETVDGIMAELDAGRMFLEVSPSGESLAILQPVQDLHVVGVAGDMAEVLQLEESVSRTAKLQYDRMTITPSRSGWDRILQDRGWKAESGLVKDL